MRYLISIISRPQPIMCGFYAISGELKYQPEKQDAEMRVTIPVSALNTGVDAFDNHIRSSDILDAEKISRNSI